eukprot:1311450-Pleurochrysis_carterae.AAC.1
MHRGLARWSSAEACDPSECARGRTATGRKSLCSAWACEKNRRRAVARVECRNIWAASHPGACGWPGGFRQIERSLPGVVARVHVGAVPKQRLGDRAGGANRRERRGRNRRVRAAVAAAIAIATTPVAAVASVRAFVRVAEPEWRGVRA